MTILSLTGLTLGLMAAISGPDMEHRTRIDHASGAIDAHYSARVAVVQKQIGTVGAAGRPSTLRCQYRAGVEIDRRARHTSGTLLHRSFEGAEAVQGSHAGWCKTDTSAIKQKYAERLRKNLLAAAADDHHALTDEVGRLHGVDAG